MEDPFTKADLITEIPARLGDFGRWNFWSSSLMAAMMGAVSPSVEPFGCRRNAIFTELHIPMRRSY